jgi:hypothetical protein
LLQHTKMWKSIPNNHKIFQMAINNQTSSTVRPSKIYPNWYFVFENMPSGIPVFDGNESDLKISFCSLWTRRPMRRRACMYIHAIVRTLPAKIASYYYSYI